LNKYDVNVHMASTDEDITSFVSLLLCFSLFWISCFFIWKFSITSVIFWDWTFI